jgi:hypothetical protein
MSPLYYNPQYELKREKYDKKRMSINMRNSLFLWSGVLLLGAVLSYFFSISNNVYL